jgi:hypothetical protein
MNALRTLFAAAFLASVTARAAAPPIIVPSDIAVTLTATPTTNLVPGQRIFFTLTVTNLGPATVHNLIVQSSPIYGEFDISTGTVDCQYMGLQVVDDVTDFYYLYVWYLAGFSGDFPAGETRTCHISFLITAQAPAVTPFSFGLPYYYVDINPTNDIATVFLQRTVDAVPALSPMMLGLLAAVLAVAGAVAWRLKVNS